MLVVAVLVVAVLVVAVLVVAVLIVAVLIVAVLIVAVLISCVSCFRVHFPVCYRRSHCRMLLLSGITRRFIRDGC